MDKSMLVGTVLGAASVVSIAGYASYQAFNIPRYADVLDVRPVTQVERDPQQECQTGPVVHRKPVQDQNRIGGTVLGGVVGGLLGNQVGRGSGRDVATIAGAAAGGYAGNQVQKNMQDNDTYTTMEQHCRTVTRETEKVVGYDVKYSLHGELGTVRMDHKPGDRIPVKDGKLVLNETT